MNIDELRNIVSAMEGEREPRMEIWRKIRALIVPHRGLFEAETPRTVYDYVRRRLSSVATRANRSTAAGITTSLTPQSVKWFRLELRNWQQAEQTGVRAYLDEVESIMFTTLASSGFYQAIHGFNLDLTSFGCALLFCDIDDEKVARFEECVIGTWAVNLNHKKELAKVMRKLKFDASFLVNKFNNKVSHNVKKVANDAKQINKDIKCVHIVMENKNYDPTKMDSFKYLSYLFEEDAQGSILLESGYKTMPYMFAAWDSSHNVYGSGPGDQALADVMQAQAMQRILLDVAEKQASPPMIVPNSYFGRVDISAGTQIKSDNAQGIKPALEFNLNPQLMQFQLDKIEQAIRDNLLATIFESIPLDEQMKGVTATAILQKKQERIQQLGPAIAKYLTQLDTMLIRVYALLEVAGEFPIPPDIGENGTIDIVYTSPLTHAMKQQNIESTSALLEFVTGLAQITPEALDKINVDEVLDEMASSLGAPGRIIRSDDEVAKIRIERQQAQAKAQEQQMAMQGMEQILKAGNIKTENTLAGKVLDGAVQ